jgi:hypothetical protein
MSSATPVLVITAIRAVTFILKKHIVCEIAKVAAQQLTTTLTNTLAESITNWLVDHTIAVLAPQIAEVHTTSQALARMAQKADILISSLNKAKRLYHTR